MAPIISLPTRIITQRLYTNPSFTMRLVPPCMAILAGFTLAATALRAPPMDASSYDPFDWSEITPSHNLTYVPCYSGYQCARLLVPLDYANLSSSTSDDQRTAALAIIKLPAAVPSTDPTFAGPVLANPGGPSGSGVHLVLEWGQGMRDILDTPGEQHFEIVSWDPRGVGLTIPRADCYGPGNKFARHVDEIRNEGFGGWASAGEYDVAKKVGMAVGRSELCARREEHRYMSTASTARDMVEIIDAIAAAREEENEQHEQDFRADLKKRTTNKKEEVVVPRLQYLGFSYGTFLGCTFASMFPERVGRLILDGVVDADGYVSANVSGHFVSSFGDQDNLLDLN
jgi:pimeloyl-ACP methyl ester carboxylesterase